MKMRNQTKGVIFNTINLLQSTCNTCMQMYKDIVHMYTEREREREREREMCLNPLYFLISYTHYNNVM